MSEKVRVRFAPSPTGPLHIGGARSALFNWLLARKVDGVMLIRVEDTDLERSSRESEKMILSDLRWLGLDWDEGIEVGGENGPYRQSERLSLYKPYLERLLASGQAYYCYCSEEELEKERESCKQRGEMPRYSGRCRHLPVDEVDSARKPVLRFKVPAGQQVVIDDLVRGKVVFDTDGIGDFIIIKSGGLPTYNFAVVVDDIEMKISHIVRGEEHLSNTPRQVLLYQALEVKPPAFAHISLILGEDRSKMSKRHGATAISQYRAKGYLPEALLNYLAFLGWSPAGEEEIFSLEELVQAFSLERVAKSPAVFSLEKLDWLNGYYLRKTSAGRIRDMAFPYWQQAGFIGEKLTTAEKEWLAEVVASVQEKLVYVSQIADLTALYFGETKEPANQEARDILKDSEQVLQEFLVRIDNFPFWDEKEIKQGIKKLGKDLQVKGKKLFMPVRVAASGQTWGPELPTMLRLLGRERVKQRVGYMLTRLRG